MGESTTNTGRPSAHFLVSGRAPLRIPVPITGITSLSSYLYVYPHEITFVGIEEHSRVIQAVIQQSVVPWLCDQHGLEGSIWSMTERGVAFARFEDAVHFRLRFSNHAIEVP